MVRVCPDRNQKISRRSCRMDIFSGSDRTGSLSSMTRYNILWKSPASVYRSERYMTSGRRCGVPNRPNNRVKYVAEMCRTLNSIYTLIYCVYCAFVDLAIPHNAAAKTCLRRATSSASRITHEVHKNCKSEQDITCATSF